jgi:hypothetical protein
MTRKWIKEGAGEERVKREIRLGALSEELEAEECIDEDEDASDNLQRETKRHSRGGRQ